MNLTRVLTIVFFAVSAYLGYYLYGSVRDTIQSRKIFAEKEAKVVEKLKLIRTAEILFQSVYGQYTANWDSLIHFIKNERLPIIERKEEIIQKEYGGEDVIVHVDTLGYVSVWDQIFKKQFTMAAAEDGIFMGFKVKPGDQVLKNQRAYSIKMGNRILSPPFSEEGIISSLADVSSGMPVSKGQVLINFSNYIFDPKTNIDSIAYKPDSENTKFDVFVGTIDDSGLNVSVIEVKDPLPDNPERSEANESSVRKPLRFGSRKEASTAGNWE